MEGYNKVILKGTVGADAEVKTLEGGNAVATMSIAINESYTDKTSGERKTNTEWVRIEAWRGLANFLGKHGKKGTNFYIEGKYKTETWQQEGVTKYSHKFVADTVRFVGSRPTEQSTVQNVAEQSTSPVAQATQNNTQTAPVAQATQNNTQTAPVAQATVTSGEFIGGMQNGNDDDLPF